MRGASPARRARLSLEGLSVGDAFGERFFGDPSKVARRIARREIPPGKWSYTDDTQMAVVLFEVLIEYGEVQQDTLVKRFAERMDPTRGYGIGTYALLSEVLAGRDWRPVSRSSFGGVGSFGNGAAMRVAPLGGFFADAELGRVIEQATLSAEVTHSHPEGIAGAVAVSIGAALAWQARGGPALGLDWLEAVRDATPQGHTRQGIDAGMALPGSATVSEAAAALGNGSQVTAPDTVPLCLWIASRYSSHFSEAIWQTVSALGDRDTTCAIVGGMIALQTGADQIPDDWLAARESLPTPATDQA